LFQVTKEISLCTGYTKNTTKQMVLHRRFHNNLRSKTLLPLLIVTAATTKFIQVKAMSTASSSAAIKNNSPAALIFLHGLGDSPAGWSSLEEQMPNLQPSLANLKYVFPQSPTIPISINGGMTMPGWFDLYDWPIGIGVKDDDEGLRQAVQVVEECVKKLESEGVPKDRIVVGGFSQGGAVALRAAFHNESDNGNFAACVSLSGWLTFKESKAADVPLFLGHGSFDDKVLFEQQNHAEVILTEQGIKHLESKSYSMGHSSHPQEMTDMAKFLDSILFSKESDE